MQGEKKKGRDTTKGGGQQQAQTPREEPNPVGQDSAKSEYGEIGETAQPRSGSEPPRSMGTRGTEFGQFGERGSHGQQGQSGTGQADLGSQAGTTLSGHTDQQDLGEIGGEVDQPGSFAGGTSGRQAEPLIGRESGGADEDLVEREDQAFAPEGQGALKQTPDEETGKPGRRRNRDGDIERGGGI
jgi:hypothetical protein